MLDSLIYPPSMDVPEVEMSRAADEESGIGESEGMSGGGELD
jgi:hypothetical protein